MVSIRVHATVIRCFIQDHIFYSELPSDQCTEGNIISYPIHRVKEENMLLMPERYSSPESPHQLPLEQYKDPDSPQY